MKLKPDGTEKYIGSSKVFRRLRLKRHDGTVYLDRWGVQHQKVGGIYLHHMTAPDPGLDLHNHPWTFVTIPIWGGYQELRNNDDFAVYSAQWLSRGELEKRKVFRPRKMKLNECHRIIKLNKKSAWSIVIMGPVRRNWGFFTPDGYVEHDVYETTQIGEGRTLDKISNE